MACFLKHVHEFTSRATWKRCLCKPANIQVLNLVHQCVYHSIYTDSSLNIDIYLLLFFLSMQVYLVIIFWSQTGLWSPYTPVILNNKSCVSFWLSFTAFITFFSVSLPTGCVNKLGPTMTKKASSNSYKTMAI